MSSSHQNATAHPLLVPVTFAPAETDRPNELTASKSAWPSSHTSRPGHLTATQAHAADGVFLNGARAASAWRLTVPGERAVERRRPRMPNQLPAMVEERIVAFA